MIVKIGIKVWQVPVLKNKNFIYLFVYCKIYFDERDLFVPLPNNLFFYQSIIFN
jgi:hypothetical protein